MDGFITMAPHNGSHSIQKLHKGVHEQMHWWVHQSSHNDIVELKGSSLLKKCMGHTLALIALKTGDPSVFRVIVMSPLGILVLPDALVQTSIRDIPIPARGTSGHALQTII